MPRWIKVAGSLNSIAVGGAGLMPSVGGKKSSRTDQIIWGTSAENRIFVRGFDRDRLGQWQMIPGALTQIAVATKADSSGVCPVWGIGPKQQVFRLKLGRSGEVNWESVAGTLKYISVGPFGVWGVNSENKIFELKASGYRSSWVSHEGALTTIAVGDSDVWGTSRQGHIYRGVRSEGKMVWTQIDGSLTHIAVAGSLVCGVNEKGKLFYKHESLPWGQLASDDNIKFVRCATNGWSVWGLDVSGGVWLWGD